MLLIVGMVIAFVWMGLTVREFDRRAQWRLVAVIAALSVGELVRILA